MGNLITSANMQGPPGPVAASVSSLATLSGFPQAGVSWPAGTIVAYQAVVGGPSVYYQWAPGSLATPDAVNVVAGIGGNFLIVTGFGGNGLQSKTANYQLASNDNGADFTVGGLTCTMPTNPIRGWQYLVSVGAAGNLTVQGGGKNINGQASLPLAAPYQSVTLVFNGSEYRAF